MVAEVCACCRKAMSTNWYICHEQIPLQLVFYNCGDHQVWLTVLWVGFTVLRCITMFQPLKTKFTASPESTHCCWQYQLILLVLLLPNLLPYPLSRKYEHFTPDTITQDIISLFAMLILYISGTSDFKRLNVILLFAYSINALQIIVIWPVSYTHLTLPTNREV